jgi:hypothetical protein
MMLVVRKCFRNSAGKSSRCSERILLGLGYPISCNPLGFRLQALRQLVEQIQQSCAPSSVDRESAATPSRSLARSRAPVGDRRFRDSMDSRLSFQPKVFAVRLLPSRRFCASGGRALSVEDRPTASVSIRGIMILPSLAIILVGCGHIRNITSMGCQLTAPVEGTLQARRRCLGQASPSQAN